MLRKQLPVFTQNAMPTIQKGGRENSPSYKRSEEISLCQSWQWLIDPTWDLQRLLRRQSPSHRRFCWWSLTWQVTLSNISWPWEPLTVSWLLTLGPLPLKPAQSSVSKKSYNVKRWPTASVLKGARDPTSALTCSHLLYQSLWFQDLTWNDNIIIKISQITAKLENLSLLDLPFPTHHPGRHKYHPQSLPSQKPYLFSSFKQSSFNYSRKYFF